MSSCAKCGRTHEETRFYTKNRYVCVDCIVKRTREMRLLARNGLPPYKGPRRTRYEGVDNHAMSLDEIAAVMGTSRQRVHQIEQSALKKLRESGVLDDWMDFLRKREMGYGDRER